MNPKPHRPSRHPIWRRLRIYFRRFRLTVWCGFFLLLAVGIYLNVIGLPKFIERPLLENLRARGLDFETSRLRVSWHRGLVADDVRLRGVDQPVLPRFSARAASVQVSLGALLHRRLEVSGLVIRDGSLVWNLTPGAPAPDPLAITNINATLRLDAGDLWTLERCEAGAQGVKFNAFAVITNGSALRTWPVFQGRTRQPPEVVLARLRALETRLAQLRFIHPPQILINLGGDGNDPRTFTAFVQVAAPGAETPWGRFDDARLRATLSALTADAPTTIELSLNAARVTTEWASVRRLELTAASAVTERMDQLRCAASLAAESVRTRWASAGALHVEAGWLHAVTNPLPVSGEVFLTASNATVAPGRVGQLALTVRAGPATNPLPADPALGFWNQLLPHRLALETALTNVALTNFTLPRLAVAADWAAPRLTVERLEAQFADGPLAAAANLNVTNRALQFNGTAGFDVQQLAPLLTPKSRDWIGQFQWAAPPGLAMSGRLRLPAWTNRQPDWRTEVKPTIELAGSVALTNASYRGITAQRAHTRLAYTNHLWQLPDLTLTRPEGALRVNLQSHELTHAYRIQLDGALHPAALAPLLDEKGRRGLGYIESASAPEFAGTVTGRWYERDSIRADARVTWTNFSFRGQHADRLEAALTYSNQVLDVFQPRVERGAERVTADRLRFDFVANRAWLTNGYTDTDPVAIATAIGPKVAAAVQPYRFLTPPVARVNGIIPLRGERDADLHFDLAGGPFHWTIFKLPHIAGHICWANESVTLSNVTAQFYGGAAAGDAWFDVRERGTTPYRFNVAVTNADLHALMSDVHSPTNQLEGIFSGLLVITNAETHDWQSWNGYGHAHLRNGLIWNTPIFGVMSKVMNTIVPGIGNSRAHEARGNYIITNSVIFTRDLDIRASGMRLQYEGTVDFQKRVNARVQAELLRDAPVFGQLMSTVLWPVSKLFEYKVTGTLAEPNPQPLYLIPKIFLAPLSPVRSLKNIFSGDREKEIQPAAPVIPGDPPPAAP